MNLTNKALVRVYLFLLKLLISNTLYAQTVIEGYVSNTETSKGVYASVVLKDENGKIIAYTNTKNEGYFELKTSLKGVFNLIVSSLSYEAQSIKIIIESNTSNIKKNIVLTPKVTELKEVVIQTRRPITVKKDTVVFDAKSFTQGNEQVVEDLLKKIPGLNVQSDGTIKIGNQEVEKVMIDGDDLFEKGYKILTKNMPVNPIDKVILYQNYSNNKHLKGIENSDKVALNLTLKEDAKRVWFGNLLLGLAPQSEIRHEIRGNLMNFGKKNKYYFITNLNNIGRDATGDISHLIRPFRIDEPSSLGDTQKANQLVNVNNELPNLSKKRTVLNNVKMISLNSIFTLSDKVKVKTLGFFNLDKTEYYKDAIQVFKIGNLSFQNKEKVIANKRPITGFGKLDFTYDISKSMTLEYTGKINHTDELNQSNLTFNAATFNENLQSNNELLDQKAVLTHKWKENKVLLLTGRYIDETTPQTYHINPFRFSDIFDDKVSFTNQLSKNRMKFMGIEAHIMSKKTQGNLWELKLGGQRRTDQLSSSFQLGNDEQEMFAKPQAFQNDLTYTTTDVYLSTKNRFKIKQIYLVTQLDLHHLSNSLRDTTATSQNLSFVVPKIGLDWKINEKHKVLSSYTYSTTNLEIADLYKGYIQTDFRSFNKGLGEFNQLNASNAIVQYTLGNWSDKFFANIFLAYVKNYDFVSSSSIVTSNAVISEKILIKNRAYWSLSSNIDRYLTVINANLKMVFGATKSSFQNRVNAQELREINNQMVEYGFELRSGFKGKFNYHIGSKWTSTQFQINTNTANSFTNNMSFVDISLVLNDRCNLQLQAERYYFGSLAQTRNTYYFMDFDARYVVKENKLTLSLSGNNLLNTQNFSNYTLTDISFIQTTFRLQPRYVMLKAEFRF